MNKKNFNKAISLLFVLSVGAQRVIPDGRQRVSA